MKFSNIIYRYYPHSEINLQYGFFLRRIDHQIRALCYKPAEILQILSQTMNSLTEKFHVLNHLNVRYFYREYLDTFICFIDVLLMRERSYDANKKSFRSSAVHYSKIEPGIRASF